ncbi:CDP-glycerol glycerophosphotransferase family protein [Salinicoccus jeotgali]|uniref:CDP-glycerol glycerophosphotransferase family protein n=1 Tax=Salinicoccus jeotgali TaxID=381634 RepID=A0ABP7F4D5_9STAP
MGKPEIYLLSGAELRPLKYVGTDHAMNTAKHKITFSTIRGDFKVEIDSHNVPVLDFKAKLREQHLQMKFSFKVQLDVASLLIIDASTNQLSRVPVTSSGPSSEIIIDVPISLLLDNITRKRFMLETDHPEPLRLQPDIKKLKNFGFNGSIQTIYNYEKLNIWFYCRRDNLLGFKVSQKRLKRLVTDIENFRFKGFIEGSESFIESQAYLSFSDRYSQDVTRIKIDNNFDIDLKNVDFVDVKSKDKTVLDVYVEIIHNSGKVLRKVKIKYKFSKYKKDNYYASHNVQDSEGNLHYHLVTTTPFDNLKLESFKVPANVKIPLSTERKDMNVWLLGERYDTAQDNGYALFKWLKENTDIEPYYVIEDTAQDYQKIKNEKNVLAFGSELHYYVSFKAGVLLGTHDLENLLPYKTARGFFHYEDTIKVFLQHGVLGRKPVEYNKKYYDIPFDLFIVSSEPEKEDVVKNKMGYSDEEIAVTGLARFDLLPYKNQSRDILLMPTWRDWINSDEKFISSEYYQKYYNLIHNERLNRILKDNNVQLNFYPHYRSQTYFNSEHLDLGSNIHFMRLGEKSVQSMLKEHALLITDYSSVSFDFKLMDKPVIYYHFDAQKFFRQGMLRPLHQTFIGDVAKTEDKLIDTIEYYIESNFAPKDFDLSGVFKYRDHNNRKRIYDAVVDIINQKSF